MAFDPTDLLKQKELSELKKKLDAKTHITSSNDGFITFQYTGSGDYKKITINKDLKEVNKEQLEKDILDLINYSKNQMSADFTEIMLSGSQFLDQESDSDGIEERKDVS